jgi:hypothetical protein
MKNARTRLVECSTEELEAQDEYDEIYYDLTDTDERDFQ